MTGSARDGRHTGASPTWQVLAGLEGTPRGAEAGIMRATISQKGG
jgi:hypothetical protein